MASVAKGDGSVLLCVVKTFYVVCYAFSRLFMLFVMRS
jgi:hypothetical protein